MLQNFLRTERGPRRPSESRLKNVGCKTIDIEDVYKNDNFLLKSLSLTKRMTRGDFTEGKIKEIEKVLNEMTKEIKRVLGPKYWKIREENRVFNDDYNKVLNMKKQEENLFLELKNAYANRAYKIPSLSVEHNLFKLNPLLEENMQKIMLFIKNSNKSKKGPRESREDIKLS